MKLSGYDLERVPDLFPESYWMKLSGYNLERVPVLFPESKESMDHDDYY